MHQLCYGAFLQGPLWLGPDTLAVGLFPFGIKVYAEYMSVYVNEFLEGTVGEEGVNAFSTQGRDAVPGLAVIRFLAQDDTPEALEAEAAASLVDARRALAWVTNEDPVPFALVTRTTDQTYFRPIVPFTRRLQRLGFGNTGEQYEAMIERLLAAARADDRFEFALSLYHDAVNEENQWFRIARFFNCLECLAFRLKRGGVGSRKAVRELLGMPDGAMMEVTVGDGKVRFDRIEIAGRIRDKLFHGVPFNPSDLNEASRPVFQLLAESPKTLADSIMTTAGLELARWANGVSNGLAAEVEEPTSDVEDG